MINNLLSGAIYTLAGNGAQNYSGDAGPARATQLGVPYAVVTDASGDQYVVDNLDNSVREILADGSIITVAGNPMLGPGFSGDGGPATSARLNDPRGAALNSAGDLFISDTGNNRIRKVDHATRVITTIAGNGIAGFSGDGGAATAAELNVPRHIAVAADGRIYVADTANNRVRMIDPGTGRISTIAGTGAAGFSGDGGLATAARLSAPRGLAFDASGDLFVSDTGNNRVREVNLSGHISTVAGNGTAGSGGDGRQAVTAELDFPFGLTFDAGGNLYIADTLNNKVRIVAPDGTITTLIGGCGGGFAGDGGPAVLAELNIPYGVAVDPQGDVFVADAGNNRIRGAYQPAILRSASCASGSSVAGGRSAHGGGSSGSPGPRTDSARAGRFGPSSATSRQGGSPMRTTTQARSAVRHLIAEHVQPGAVQSIQRVDATPPQAPRQVVTARTTGPLPGHGSELIFLSLITLALGVTILVWRRRARRRPDSARRPR